MRVIALLLSPRYQLLPKATPRTIVGTEGTTKVLLPEYQVYRCFIILNNCAIQNSKLLVLFWWISSLLYKCFLKLIHFHVCAFEEEINKKKKKNYLVRSFLYWYWLCPPIEGNRIIPLYTNSLTLQHQSYIFVVYR